MNKDWPLGRRAEQAERRTAPGCRTRTFLPSLPRRSVNREHLSYDTGDSVWKESTHTRTHTPSRPEWHHRVPVGCPNTPRTHTARHPSVWPQQRLPRRHLHWAPVSLFYSVGLHVVLTLLHHGICCFHLGIWCSLYRWWNVEAPSACPVHDAKWHNAWFETFPDEHRRCQSRKCLTCPGCR